MRNGGELSLSIGTITYSPRVSGRWAGLRALRPATRAWTVYLALSGVVADFSSVLLLLLVCDWLLPELTLITQIGFASLTLAGVNPNYPN